MLRACAALICSTFFTVMALAIFLSTDSIFGPGLIFLGGLFIAVFYVGIFGVPALFYMSSKKWGAWWQSVILGILIPKPLGLDFGSNIYTFTMFTIAGVAGGLTLWIVGIFRNPEFTSPKQKFPFLVLATPLAAIPLIMYLQALESKWVYGCIIDYELAENPTPENHAVVTVLLNDGEKYQSGVKREFSDPDIIGNCALGSLEPKASLKDSNYLLVSTRSNNCSQICPNQN